MKKMATILGMLTICCALQSNAVAEIAMADRDWTEEIARERVLYKKDFCCYGLKYVQAPGKENYPFEPYIHLQGNFIYYRYQLSHLKDIGESNSGPPPIYEEYFPYATHREWNLKRLNLITGELEAFKAPKELTDDSRVNFLMSPSGKFGLFYDIGNFGTYFSELNSGRVITQEWKRARYFSFLSDDTAVFFSGYSDAKIVKPTGETLEVKLDFPSDQPIYEEFELAQYDGRKISISSLVQGQRYIIDFDRIETNSSGKAVIQVKSEPLKFPTFFPITFKTDYVLADVNTCKVDESINCREIKTGEITISEWDAKVGNLYNPKLYSYLMVSKLEKIKRYRKSKEMCFRSEIENPSNPYQMQSFCIGGIYDELSKKFTATIGIPKDGSSVEVNGNFSTAPEFVSFESQYCNKTKSYNEPAFCNFDAGPFPVLENAKIRRHVTRDLVRVNGFEKLVYGESWFLVSPDSKEYKYNRK